MAKKQKASVRTKTGVGRARSAKTKGGSTKKGGSRKAPSTSKTSKNPRPKLTDAFQKRLKSLRDELEPIIRDGEDKKGKLDAVQLDKARRMKAALDQAVIDVYCVQFLTAY